MTNKNYGTYSLNISNSNQYLAEDPYDWWDISEPDKEGKKRKRKKKKKKTAKKRKKAIKKKKAAKKAKQKRRAEKQRAQEFRYQLLIKATDTACDITKMYFYSKFGSPT